MNWLTKEEVKREAKNPYTALQCSIRHHYQLIEASLPELMLATKQGKTGLSSDYCALCQHHEEHPNFQCPLNTCINRPCDFTCNPVWVECVQLLDVLKYLYKIFPNVQETSVVHRLFIRAEQRLIKLMENK